MAALKNLLEDFHHGNKIRTFDGFFKSAGYLENALPENQKLLWVKVFEAFFSRGDSSLNRDDVATSFMDEIGNLNLGICRDVKMIPTKPTKRPRKRKAEDEEEDPEAEESESQTKQPFEETFWISENIEDGEDYVIYDDDRKIEVFGMLRTTEVFLLQFDWVIFHFGSKVAMYVAKIEHFKSLLIEMSRPVPINAPDREKRYVLRSKISEDVEKAQKEIDNIRWSLFGIAEEKVNEIQVENRQKDLANRRRAESHKKG